MNFIPIILILLTFSAIIGLYICYRRQVKHQSERTQFQSGHRTRRAHHSTAPLVALGGLVVVLMATLIAYCAYAQILDDEAPAPSEASSPVSEESQPDDLVATSRPIKSVSELFPDFRLSTMTDSELLKLSDLMIDGESLTFDLIFDARERFKVFLETISHPASFFPYYNGLADYFPDGDEVIYTFSNVENREQCDAQLRGAGQRLEEAKNGSSMNGGQIAKPSYQMAIRALDAMGFTKYTGKQTGVDVEAGRESQQEWSIWLYAEIFLPSQLNSYIYGQSNNAGSYVWYYSFGQVYDYLGGIADNEELEMEMYFCSAVFLHETFWAMEEGGFQVSFENKDHKKWELYVEMLYRVATRSEASVRDAFFQEIQRVENIIRDQQFPEEIHSSMARTIETLVLYTEWREAE